MADTKERARQVVAEHLCVKQDMVEEFTDLVEDLGADSLDCVELTMAIEEEFEIMIPDEEAEQVKYFSEVVKLVEKYT